MKKNKQSIQNLQPTKSDKSYKLRLKGLNVNVQNIESLDVNYDVRDTQILSIDGAMVTVEEQQAKILFYSAPLLSEPNVSFVKCPFEIRMTRAVLLSFVEDLLNQTSTFLIEEKLRASEISAKKPPEGMFS